MPSSFRKGVMACTGIEFCKLAIGETKGRARWLAEELDRRLPGFDEEIRIHVNGCPNSCARFQVADIGLMSALEASGRDEVRRVPRAPWRHGDGDRSVRSERKGVRSSRRTRPTTSRRWSVGTGSGAGRRHPPSRSSCAA